MRVSTALIVKNEGGVLGRCLESIQGCVDEIVVVDTGSEDQTRAIARQHTDCVYEFPWRKDFAAARQFSFDRTTGDWVLWLDADDIVLNAAQIRPSLLDVASDVKGFYWKYVYGQDEYGHPTCELWRERCVRNDATFHWVGCVHEILVPNTLSKLVRNDAVVVVHHPDSRRLNRDPRRNIAILEASYEQAKKQPEPRLLLYMGNEYADLGLQDLALEFLERYVRISHWDQEKYLAQIKIAALHRRQGRYAEALEAALQALKTYPQWPDAYYSLGETYYFLQDWPKVIHWMEFGRLLPMPNTLCAVNPMHYKYEWIIYYTNALYHVGRFREALEWTQNALAICPEASWHVANQRFFAEATN